MAIAPSVSSRRLEHQLTNIAHRGASAYAPENTLPATERGVELKADFVEIDVQLTKDDEVVVMHDVDLRRTTDVEHVFPNRDPYTVGDFTLEEIKQLDAASWFGKSFDGTRVPTLQQVLDILRGRAGLLLEVKSPDLYPGLAEKILGVLEGEGWLSADACAGWLVVQSFDWGFMEHFNDLAPEVPAGLLGGPPAEQRLREFSRWADQINPNNTNVDRAFVELVHEVGMVTWPYTVDEPDRMRQMIDLGVDGIITSRPDVLRTVLHTQPAKT